MLPEVSGVNCGVGRRHPGSRVGTWAPGVTEGLELQAHLLGLGRMNPKEQEQRRSCVPPPQRGQSPPCVSPGNPRQGPAPQGGGPGRFPITELDIRVKSLSSRETHNPEVASAPKAEALGLSRGMEPGLLAPGGHFPLVPAHPGAGTAASGCSLVWDPSGRVQSCPKCGHQKPSFHPRVPSWGDLCTGNAFHGYVA